MVDDQPLRPSHDFRLQYDGQSAKLEIRDAQPEDTGTYAVKITNEYGTKESTAKLIVQADPDKNHVPPEFQAVIEDAECNEGDTVKFKAVLTGDPDPEVTWLVNGIPLTESEKIKFICEDGICIVTIKDVSRHFDGTITCQGKNRLGTSSCDAHLRVRVPPSAPQFERPLEDRVITEKGAVMFECDVSGYPDPKVEFTLKGKTLVNGQDGVEILQRDGNFRITISYISMDKHDGEIIAKAVNQHGQAESRAKLTVEPEEEESRSAPTFIRDIEDQVNPAKMLLKFYYSLFFRQSNSVQLPYLKPRFVEIPTQILVGSLMAKNLNPLRRVLKLKRMAPSTCSPSPILLNMRVLCFVGPKIPSVASRPRPGSLFYPPNRRRRPQNLLKNSRISLKPKETPPFSKVGLKLSLVHNSSGHSMVKSLKRAM